MPTKPVHESKRATRSRQNLRELTEDSSAIRSMGGWFVLVLMVAGIVCIAVGCIRHGFSWPAVLVAVWITGTGVAFLAIAVLELEWLERIVSMVQMGYWNLIGLFSSSWTATLSESELLGRGGARTVWFLLGIPTFLAGCLFGLRIIEF